MNVPPPSRQVQRWHAEMAQTGRVVLRTSRVKAVLLLLVSASFVAVGVLGLVATLDGAGNLALGYAWFGFVTVFGLAGIVAFIMRLTRPEILTIEPHRLSWGQNVIPWAWVRAVERHSLKVGRPGFLLLRFNETAAIPAPGGALARPLAATERSMFRGRVAPLPQNLNGGIKDQLTFLQQVHAWSRGTGAAR